MKNLSGTISPGEELSKPWQRQKDWASGEIREGSAAGAILLFLLAAIFLLVTAFMQVKGTKQSGSAKATPAPAWFLAIFYGATALLLWASYWLAIGFVKYGRSALRLQTIPGVPGGVLAGTIRIPKPLSYHEGIHVSLRCFERLSNQKDSTELPIWEDYYILDRYTPGIAISEIPVYFRLPGDVKSTTSSSTFPHIRWTVEAKAKTMGAHYLAWFSVPVFEASQAEDLQNLPDPTLALRSDLAKAWQLRDHHMEVTQFSGGGRRYAWGPGRAIGTAISLGVTGLVFAATAIAIRFFDDREIFFPVVFGTAGGIFCLLGLRLLVLRTVVTVRKHTLTIERRWLGLGGQRQWTDSQISGFDVNIQMIQNNRPLYVVRAVLNNDRHQKIVGMIRDKHDAQGLMEQIEKDFGGS